MLEQIIQKDDIIVSSIRSEILIPSIYDQVKELSAAPKWWRRIANFTETLGVLCTSANIILAFCASSFDDPKFALYAGVIGTVGMALSKFSSYSINESKERTNELNTILSDVLHFKPVPDLTQTKGDDEIV